MTPNKEGGKNITGRVAIPESVLSFDPETGTNTLNCADADWSLHFSNILTQGTCSYGAAHIIDH